MQSPQKREIRERRRDAAEYNAAMEQMRDTYSRPRVEPATGAQTQPAAQEQAPRREWVSF